uniref:T cell activation inhibitor, mitochondrial n=1 Tax=Oryzias sinensis TaxID=183150 RepID=A0A8C7YF75_9TELE
SYIFAVHSRALCIGDGGVFLYWQQFPFHCCITFCLQCMEYTFFKNCVTDLTCWTSGNVLHLRLCKDPLMPRKVLCSFGNLLFDLSCRWQRSWGVAHRYSQLQSLTRLAHQNPDALIHLQGYTIVFADQSGMNSSGHVLLGTMDVHHQWIKVFVQLPSLRGLQHQTDCLKERISFLLGGAQVVHMERLGPVRPIAEHYRVLSTFHKKLLSQRLHLHPRSLHGLTMVLENDRSTPSLHQAGHFIIPSTCDPTHLQLFLQSHAPEARRLTLQTNR